MAQVFARCAKRCAKTFAAKPYHSQPSDLALGELEALAGALLPVLLALFHARIARKKTVGAQGGAQLRIVLGDGAREAHANGSGLTANAAAVHGAHDVDLIGEAGELQRLGGVMFPSMIRKILFRSAAIDGELAAAGAEKNAGDRFFAAASTHDPNFIARKGRSDRTQRSSSKVVEQNRRRLASSAGLRKPAEAASSG